MVTRHTTYLISAMFSALLSSTPEITPGNPETLRQCHEIHEDWIRRVGIENSNLHDIVAKSQDLLRVMGVTSGVVLSKAKNIALIR